MTSDRPKTSPRFIDHLATVVTAIDGEALDQHLEVRLNAEFPAGGEWFEIARQLCRQGRDEGWLCGREADGIRFGRAVPAGDALGRMSVDVVEMTNVVGPHHGHPNGEIDLVMPENGHARFDGRGAGWKVYGPGTAHRPTVSGGKAFILYLLPDGAIEFTRG